MRQAAAVCGSVMRRCRKSTATSCSISAMRDPPISKRWARKFASACARRQESIWSGRFSAWERRVMSERSRLHVAVLMGGWSSEREVSLSSGNGVADALESLGHCVSRVDMDRDVALRLADANPDVVFNALHGVPGEDGTVQGLLDLMGLKYTHSGMATSVIAIDKELTKLVLVPHGIRMPAGRIVRSEDLFAADPLPRPYVLKPVNEGSSVG